MPPLHLKHRREFVFAAREGQKVATKGLVLQAVPSSSKAEDAKEVVRFGITATRSIGGAVLRNRANRRLRALATEVLCSFAKRGFDYVLIARSHVIDRPFVDLKKDLKYALHQTGTYQSE